jgi:putative flippase GtrA
MITGARLAELIRFGIVGASATLAYLIIAIALDWLLPLATVYISFLAYALGAMVSFFGHRLFTFSHAGAVRGQAVKFAISTVIGFTVAILIPVIFHMFTPNITYLMVAIIVPILSFLMLKFFVFSEP